MSPQPGVEPRLGQVGRVGGEPLAQREAGRGAPFGERIELWPRALGVHMVGSERADPTEIVDTCGEEAPDVIGLDQVGRGLHAGGRAEHHPRHGDRREQLFGVEVVRAAHRGVVLRPEALDQHLLDVAVLLGHPAQGKERVDPVGERLPDTHQDPGGERDGAAPGVLDHAEADVRVLVGAAVMGAAGLVEERPGGGLQHHPHGGGDRLGAVGNLPS